MSMRNHSAFIAIGRNLSFKSDLSLERLYPSSRLQWYTPPPKPSLNEDGKFSGYIPMDQCHVKYSRASGPGGQHVNRIDTKVDLRFHVQSATWISALVKQRLVDNYKNQINKDGYFVIKSDLTRYQHLNLADALEKVRNIIRLMEKMERPEPSEESVVRRTKLREKAARERLYQKRHRSIIKNQRKSDVDGDCLDRV